MKCPRCSAVEHRVVDTRDNESGIRRRRECVECGMRFTTQEKVVPNVWVRKRDGRREEFDSNKIQAGLRLACAKRPVSTEVLARLVQEVQEAVLSSGRLEVTSKSIGEMVMQRLRDVDEIAYIRFASVYVPLGDLESVRGEIDKMVSQRHNGED
ncbi:MAG: transcriptional regulator NrdR [Anaerolineae bacterium]